MLDGSPSLIGFLVCAFGINEKETAITLIICTSAVRVR